MTVRELLEALFARFPAEHAEDWDHVGLSVGDPTDEVRGVLVALDVTPASIEAASHAGANVLVTHHPVYLKAPDAFVPAAGAYPVASEAVFSAIRHSVSVISLHTNLDRSLEVRELMAQLTGTVAAGSIECPDDAAAIGYGMLSAPLETTLGELAPACARAFSTEPRVWGAPDMPVRRLAVLGGSLGGFGKQARAAGADAIICGEAGYHVCQDLAGRGVGIVLLGHDASEQPFCGVLADAVRAAAGPATDVEIFDPPRMWWTAMEGVR